MYFEDDDCADGRAALAQEKEVTEEQIESFFGDIRPEDQLTLKRCIHQQIAAIGFIPSGVREDGRIWEKARRTVAENMIRNGLRVRDIEFSDEEPAKKAKRVEAG